MRANWVLSAMIVGLTACGPRPPTPAEAGRLEPADTRLAALYDGSCKACHTVRDAGAPLVHDHAAWAPRWRQGLPVLTDHVIQGYKAMPAGGQCAACSPDDYADLIRFMADRQGDAS